MKLLLVAINAKYIHSSLAVKSLEDYAKSKDVNLKDYVELAEYTINNTKNYIIEEIYKKNPDVIAFSCYIWSYSYVRDIARNIKRVLPKADIWFGGPEVSYDASDILISMPEVTGVMRGEGEKTFFELAQAYVEYGHSMSDCEEKLSEALRGIPGLVYRDTKGIQTCLDREPMDLNELTFPYENISDYENKIIYYEGSRGCPFSCSYCMSSIDKRVRFKNLDKIKKELAFFIENEVPQVKFVDRTFNCNHEYTKSIWRFLIENDKGKTNFHFEIAADLLDDEEIEIIASMRPGLIQMETGIQTTNPLTIKEIDRHMDFNKVADRVRKIASVGNVHQHLDLIAGLPYEGYESFKKSFDDVYALRPNQLQLGFLKVLKGSKMHRKQKDYGIEHLYEPPYEVLSTNELSYKELLHIKLVEEMTEIYYNSGQFEKTLLMLEREYQSPFDLFHELGEFYESRGLRGINHSRQARYDILRDFIEEKGFEHKEIYDETMLYDLYLRENLKSRPAWAAASKDYRSFYTNSDNIKAYLGEYERYEYKQIIRMTHMETFSLDYTQWKDKAELKNKEVDILFDYNKRSLLNNSAKVWVIGKEKA